MTDMPPGTDSAHSAERQGKLIERLLLFTDAVVAIVITLMVLEVKPPKVPNDITLAVALKGLWHEYLAVAVSFAVIGLFWMAHHRKFQWVERIDSGLVYINLLFLFAICAVPFVTAILAQHPQMLGTILYAATLASASLVSAAMWLYSKRMGLLSADTPRGEIRFGAASSLVNAAIFLGSIPVAFWNPTAAKLVWILLLFTNLFLRKLAARPA